MFAGFLRSGGFPVLHVTDYEEETARKVVYDIYSSIILRDVVQRNKIRDIELLERVVTMDDIWRDNYEGIKHMHIADFLLADFY